MNLLFVCKYNKFRSKTAEAYFKKLNKNKSIKVKSAGLIKGTPITKEDRDKNIVKKLGIDIKGQPHGLSSKILQWQDMTVIVADNVPPSIFNNKYFGKQLLVWKISDKGKEFEKREKIIRQIMTKVESLVKRLEKK